MSPFCPAAILVLLLADHVEELLEFFVGVGDAGSAFRSKRSYCGREIGNAALEPLNAGGLAVDCLLQLCDLAAGVAELGLKPILRFLLLRLLILDVFHKQLESCRYRRRLRIRRWLADVLRWR